MKKVGIINIGLYGHVNPTLEVVKRLIENGYKVFYFASQEFTSEIAKTGATVFSYKSDLAMKIPTSLSFVEHMYCTPLLFLEEAISCLPQIKEELKKLNLDFIVYDRLCLVGRILAENLQLPSVVFHATFVFNEEFALPKQVMENQSYGQAAPIMHQKLHQEFACLMERINEEFPASHFLPKDIFMHRGPLNIVFLPKIFQPSYHSFDERYVFIGPTVCEKLYNLDVSKKVDSRNIYVSLGTLFNDDADFFNLCYEAFQNTEWRVTIATGGRVHILNRGAKNIHVFSFVDQLDVLSKANVFITCGGVSSVMSALTFKVPVIVIPQSPEHMVMGRRIVDLNLGLMLERKTVTPLNLRSAVEAIAVDKTIAENIAVIRHHLIDAGGSVAAVSAMEKYFFENSV